MVLCRAAARSRTLTLRSVVLCAMDAQAIPLIQKANSATRVSGISADVSVQAPVQAACEKAIKTMGGQCTVHARHKRQLASEQPASSRPFSR